MRAILGAAGARGESVRPAAIRVAVPLPGTGGPLVGRHRLHLKQHALLPVGRARPRLVPGPPGPGAAAGAAGSALEPVGGVVRHAARARGAEAPARRDARDLRPCRAQRIVLGPSGQLVLKSRLPGARPGLPWTLTNIHGSHIFQPESNVYVRVWEQGIELGIGTSDPRRRSGPGNREDGAGHPSLRGAGPAPSRDPLERRLPSLGPRGGGPRPLARP